MRYTVSNICSHCGTHDAIPYGFISEDGYYVIQELCEDCWVIVYEYGKRYDKGTVILP